MEEQELEIQEQQVIEQVPNTYYYDKLYEDKHLGSFTESTKLAYDLGWQDNHIAKDQTEVAYNGWTYLKGFAPKKPLQLAKDQKHSELKAKLQELRSHLTVNFDNDVFDANENAQTNMNTLIGLFDLGVEQVQIRSSNEVTHTFNKEQCTQLSLLMVQAVQNLYSQYWTLKDTLYEYETLENIEKLEWKI